ncbi:hypothetical protein E1301_Tti015391 [Triplophysa tibetana]|uniref:Myb/SANT-like DNA-binding domain-containing protein n=1 Tax=Triplophysa tibetana TaxID=1572043 RepID=A0A5A9PSB0_9TELE|nr:hypothetical protein E1301_Tti015391 [Triplophysa tibetana]
MERRNLTKKRNFSELEIETLTTQVGNHSLVLFGSLKSGVKGGHKKAIWKKITDVVNSVGIESRTPAEVKKKWSDLKLATKKRVAVMKRIMETGAGQPDSSLVLMPIEERIAAIIGLPSVSGISGGGDTDASVSEQDEEQSTSAVQPPCATEAAPQRQANGDSQRVTSIPRTGTTPLPWVVMAEVLQKQTEMCQLMSEMNSSLFAINDTLKEINENIKRASQT